MTRSTTAVLLLAVLVGFVGGCTKEAVEPVQTVDWYKEHEPEMKAMLAKCATNPGQLGATPNCINANKAFEQRRISGPSAFDSMKPAQPELNRPK
jgi:hypothetical protein